MRHQPPYRQTTHSSPHHLTVVLRTQAAFHTVSSNTMVVVYLKTVPEVLCRPNTTISKLACRIRRKHQLAMAAKNSGGCMETTVTMENPPTLIRVKVL